MTIKPPSYFKHLCPPTFFKKSGAHHTKHPIISSRWWLQNYSHPWHPWHLQLLSRGLRPQLDIELSWSWLWRRNAQRQCAVWIVRVFHIVMLHQFVLLWFHFINYRSIHIHTTPTHTHIHTYIYIYIYIHTHTVIYVYTVSVQYTFGYTYTSCPSMLVFCQDSHVRNCQNQFINSPPIRLKLGKVYSWPCCPYVNHVSPLYGWNFV